MARINTNVGAVVAQRHLDTSYRQLNGSIQRLSSGLRITRGADDPAGLIVSERLRAEINSVGQAIKNTQRASTIIATTEGALDEVARLMVDIQDLIIEAANRGAFSDDEVAANQLQIDSAIDSITRIANSTTFAGRTLLDGSLDYITSGVDTSIISDVEINGAQFGTKSFLPVDIDVTQSAQPAVLNLFAGSLSSAVTLEIQGPIGVTTLPLTSAQSVSQVADAINLVSDATGVVATVSGTVVHLTTSDLGSDAFVSVVPLSGTATIQDENGFDAVRDIGRDALAFVNGALSRGNGNVLSVNTAVLDMEIHLDNNFGTGTTQFAVTSGGMLFQVGPEVNTNLQVNIGVQSVTASRLGRADLGFLSQIQSGGQFELAKEQFQSAQNIVDEAIRQVAVLRGRLGAFERNSLDTNISQLSITMENLMSSESTIRDADFAYETSQLQRNQTLVSAGTSILGLAQQVPQSILSLLG